MSAAHGGLEVDQAGNVYAQALAQPFDPRAERLTDPDNVRSQAVAARLGMSD